MPPYKRTGYNTTGKLALAQNGLGFLRVTSSLCNTTNYYPPVRVQTQTITYIRDDVAKNRVANQMHKV